MRSSLNSSHAGEGSELQQELFSFKMRDKVGRFIAINWTGLE